MSDFGSKNPQPHARLSRVSAWREIARAQLHRRLIYKVSPQRRPWHYATGWEYPNFELGSAESQQWLHGLGTNPAVLFLPCVGWHVRTQRVNHLSQELDKRGYSCFHLNPYLGQQFTDAYRTDPRHRIGIIGTRTAELHVRLQQETIYHERLLTEAEVETLAAAIGKVLETSPAGSVQITSFPGWHKLALLLRRRFGLPVVYDCHDLYVGFRNVSHDIVCEETELLETCDLALFASARLMEQHLKTHPSLQTRSILLRNGVTAENFQTTPDAANFPAGAGKPIVGYVGALDRWFHIEGVENIAKTHPQAEIWLIGAVDYQPIQALRKFANVRFLGELPYSSLPEYLCRFSAALIPFCLSELTVCTNPIKLYEYFAAGLPVVSSRLPEVENYGDLVYLADSAEEFAARVRQALAEANPLLRRRRVQVANTESWSVRGDVLTESIQQLLSGNRQCSAAKAPSLE
jgi:glycosyltransferase involved in cell wall biosynthesis